MHSYEIWPYISYLMSFVSCVTSHISHLMFQTSCLMYHVSWLISQVLHITFLKTYVTGHRSHVTSHRSCFSSYKSHISSTRAHVSDQIYKISCDTTQFSNLTSHIWYPPGATCNRVDGKCKCKPGYAGNRCEDHCPEGYFGADCYQACQCESENYLCHPTRGCVCQPRYGGSELFHFHFLFYNFIICR